MDNSPEEIPVVNVVMETGEAIPAVQQPPAGGEREDDRGVQLVGRVNAEVDVEPHRLCGVSPSAA